jgi:hypothetical protein
VNGKHSTYFELRDAIDVPGCVICRLAARSVRRYLEVLSFESVNDRGLRAQLRRARGFCNLHAWQLLDEVRDPFGAGIIYRDVLNDCRLRLTEIRLDALAARGPCLACQARSRSSGRYVDVLTEHLAGDLADRLLAAGGLCWRHFALAVARAGRGLVDLADGQRAAIEVLMGGGSRGAGWTGPARASRLPGPGIRAGNAAPRPTPDEVAADPLVAMAVGLPGTQPVAVENLEARAWESEAVDSSRSGGWPEGAPPIVGSGSTEAAAHVACTVCRVAADAASRAVGALPTRRVGPLELCAPHAWQALEAVGLDHVRARLAPALELLLERIDRSRGQLARASPLMLGPFALATPAARRSRGELALRLVPGSGCVICQAQLVAEEEALLSGSGGPLCRPHLLAAVRLGVSPPLAQTEDHWRAVVADLDEYVRKADYRFRDEPRGAEQSSPWRAVAMVAAADGVR